MPIPSQIGVGAIGGAAMGPPADVHFAERDADSDFGRGRYTTPLYEAPRTVRRVNVNFSDQAYETLEELARRSGKSMSEVLREAIALKAWFDRERAEGNRILVERPNGQVREVISV